MRGRRFLSAPQAPFPGLEHLEPRLLLSGTPIFTKGQTLPEYAYISADWVDYDSDGDLDAMLADRDPPSFYSNDGGVLSRQNTVGGLPRVLFSDWGDYDNDGDLDLVSWDSGGSYYDTNSARIVRNDGDTWTEIDPGTEPVRNGMVSWIDYDSDGDLDIFLNGSALAFMIYRNEGGIFTYAEYHDSNRTGWSLDSGDFDNDGDADLLVGGTLYRNNGGLFVPHPTVTGTSNRGRAEFGDYDADGDLDVLSLTGYGDAARTIIYRNDGGGAMTNINAALPALYDSAMGRWTDFDNDGDLDVALSGYRYTGGLQRYAALFRNDAGVFTEQTGTGLTSEGDPLAWGDYDTDGDLDLLVSVYPSSTSVYVNHLDTPNNPPAPPDSLTTTRDGASVSFTWTRPSDDHTPTTGLSYNLRVGTSPGGGDILAPTSDWVTGFQRLAEPGLAASNLWKLNLGEGTYHWSVQAVDSVYAGSAWSAEQSFTVIGPTVSIGNVSVTETDGGSQQAQFTVMPSWASPNDISVDFVVTDGTATAGEDYTPVTGTLTIPGGQSTGTISVPVLGDWLDEGDETFFVVLSNPTGAQVGGTGVGIGTILDNDPLTVAIGDVSVVEGDSGQQQAVFTVTGSRVSDAAWSVHYATSDITAVAGLDYSATSGTLHVPAGRTVGTISVPILGDSLREETESFVIALNPSVGARVVGTGTALGNILDDDTPWLSIADAQVREGEQGEQVAGLTVTISKAVGFDVRVSFTTSDGTATAGSDYTHVTGELTIPAGQTAATVAVPVWGDTEEEGDETVAVALSDPVNAILSTPTALLTILEDDAEFVNGQDRNDQIAEAQPVGSMLHPVVLHGTISIPTDVDMYTHPE